MYIYMVQVGVLCLSALTAKEEPQTQIAAEQKRNKSSFSRTKQTGQKNKKNSNGGSIFSFRYLAYRGWAIGGLLTAAPGNTEALINQAEYSY